MLRCLDMMDGDGALAHYPRAGGLNAQPGLDMMVYRIIRHEWVRLQNEKLKGGAPHGRGR